MGYRVGVLGATGAVGSTILEILAERRFPADEVVAFTSERSTGRRVAFAGSELECRVLDDESIQGLDIVLSSAGGSVSAEWAPRLVDAGAVVVDNTSYWRMHDDVPLVVSEVNPDAAADHVPGAVKALHEAFELGEDAVRREEPAGEAHRPRVTS